LDGIVLSWNLSSTNPQMLSEKPHIVHEYSQRIEALHVSSGTEIVAGIIAQTLDGASFPKHADIS